MKEAAQCRQFDELRTGDGMVGQVIFFCTLQICSQSFSNPVVYIPKLFKNNFIFQICFQSFQNQLYIFLSVLQEHHGACGKCSKGVKKDLLNNFENRSSRTPEMDSNQSGAGSGAIWGPFLGSLTHLGASGRLRSQKYTYKQGPFWAIF